MISRPLFLCQANGSPPIKKIRHQNINFEESNSKMIYRNDFDDLNSRIKSSVYLQESCISM